MRKSLFALLLSALLLGTISCSDNDSPSKGSTSAVDQDEDNTTEEINESYTYKLPVIFHVLYHDASDPKQYVSATRLAEILGRVNRLYKGGYYSTDIGNSQDINIQFVLASHDENGNKLATPGVEYIKWSGTYPIDANTFMNDNKSGYNRYLWEPNDFINVMVYNFAPETGSNEVTLGISHLPFTLQGVNETDGLTALEASKAGVTKRNLSFAYCTSINSLYMDYECDRYTNASHNLEGGQLTQVKFDVNLTLAHELGHYLGLLHAFAEVTDANGNVISTGCGDTDYCSDTPSYNRPKYISHISEYMNNIQGNSVSFKELAKRTSCDGTEFTATNIMDYAYTYGYELTAQQKERIRRVLYNSPLMPGPKLRLRNTTRTGVHTPAPEGQVDLPIRTIK